MPKAERSDVELMRTWTLPPAASFGSSVRAKGILQELQSRLPATSRKALSLEGMELILAMPARDKSAFHAAAAIIARVYRRPKACRSFRAKFRTSSPSRPPNGCAG